MARWLRKLPAVLLIGLLCTLAFADEEPAPPTEEQAAAEKLRRSVSTPDQALFNGLRYLLRPQFEEQLFEGRRYRPAPLPSFETSTVEAFTSLEALRLWALLESGMPLSSAADGHLRRMLSLPVPDSALNLGPGAVRMLVCRAALARDDVRSRDALRDHAAAVYKATQGSSDATSPNSKLAQGKRIEPQWFANHLWRGVIQRAAHDIGLETDAALWQSDLRALCRAWDRKSGFAARVDSRGIEPMLDANLLGLSALSVALSAPDGMLSAVTRGAIEKQVKDIVKLIEEWGDQWQTATFSGCRLLLVQTLSDQFAPARISADVWRRDNLNRATVFLDPRGVISGRNSLVGDMGLVEPGWVREQSVAAETALALVGLTGGLLRPGKGPLAQHNLASVGRYLHAFAVLHASQARSGGGFNQRVRYAIEDGCNLIERSQLESGRFSGTYELQPGNTAICVLALLHGGYPRDSHAVARGLEAMTRQCEDATKRRGVGTYNAGLVLMALQKFYEPQQRAAGLFAAAPGKEFEKARAEVRKLIAPEHMALVDEILSQLNKSMPATDNGGWGYYPVKGNGDENSDNSCSQFAILGYKAAGTLGGKAEASVYKREAERLLKQYGAVASASELEYEYTVEGGKTAVAYKGKIKPGGWAYRAYSGRAVGDSMQMTAAGISTLAICLDELRARDELEPRAEFEIALRIHGAQARLALTYYTGEALADKDGALLRTARDGSGAYYNLYSVERGCELAGIARLSDAIDWYTIGAEALLEHQNLDGSWSSGSGEQAQRNLINTSMAILFLKRASLPVFTDPRRKQPEKPRDPVTGDKDAPKEQEDSDKK
jgi:hypothetical protein